MHAYYLHASVHSPRLALQLQVALHGARNVQVVVRVHTAMPISPHKHDHSSPNHLQCSRECMPNRTQQTVVCCQVQMSRDCIDSFIKWSLSEVFAKKPANSNSAQ